MLPKIIGIGAPKAGTTGLVRALAATGLFDICRMKDSDILSHNSADGLGALYAREFAGDGRPTLDFSVLYFLSDLAAANCACFAQHPKVIFLARNPLQQIKSHYWHIRHQNFHSWEVGEIMTLAELLARKPANILGSSGNRVDDSARS